MGRFEEVAVIFKRRKTIAGIEFIPIRVVDGYFSKNDEWFVDCHGHTYHHICEISDNGDVFGLRRSKKSVLESAKKSTGSYNKALERFLLAVETFTYIKKSDDEFNVVISSADGESVIYNDIDTERINKNYDSSIVSKTENNSNGRIDYTKLIPFEIVDYVKKFIVAQDEAIIQIVTSIISTKRFPNLKKRNMFLVGPTGVGKTAIMETLAKKLEIPITIKSIPGTSQAGYVGCDIDDILVLALINCNFDISKVENSIIVLEELDKIKFREGSSGAISTEGVQDELLKFIEGEIRTVRVRNKRYTVDTSKIIFVGTGACQEFYSQQNRKTIGFETPEAFEQRKAISQKDLSNLGLKPELIGRMPVLIELNALTKKDLITILKNPYGELANMVLAFESMGVTLPNIDELYDIIAEDALKKGIGARGIVTTVANIFTSAMYDILNHPGGYQKIIFGKNILVDNADYKLVSVRTKERIRQASYRRIVTNN